MNSTFLLNKTCVPCQGGQPSMDKTAATQILSELGGQWEINDHGHLAKSYRFKNFMDAMNFANKIAELAEKEGHHPDLAISWGSCRVELWTHKINGLSENDFILAAKIEALISN